MHKNGVVDEEIRTDYFNLEEEILSKLAQFESEILLIGSKIVIEQFQKWRECTIEDYFTDEQSFKLMILMLYLLFILYPEEYYVNLQTFWGEKFGKERL